MSLEEYIKKCPACAIMITILGEVICDTLIRDPEKREKCRKLLELSALGKISKDHLLRELKKLGVDEEKYYEVVDMVAESAERSLRKL